MHEDKDATKSHIMLETYSRTWNFNLINGCLLKEKNVTPEIFYIILRFKLYLTSVTGDIPKAFTKKETPVQVFSVNCLKFLKTSFCRTPPEDRFCRSLFWLDDVLKENRWILWNRFASVVLNLTSSTFLLDSCSLQFYCKRGSDSYRLLLLAIIATANISAHQ